MRILYSLLLSTLFCLSLNAQTIWTGDVSSDWTDAGNWSAGVPTSGMTVTIPGTPSGGNFPIYSGSPVIDFTIQNAGSITFDDFVYNNGTIVNFNIGTLVNNNNYFVNAGSVVFDNDGSFTNTGTFENFGVFDNAASAVFTNADGASLINHGQFINNGFLDNDGSFTNYGRVMSTDNFENSGTFSNSGTFESPNGSGVVNSTGATINVLSGGSFSHNDDFQNDGSISNDGIFITENSGTMTNDGMVTSAGTLQVSGMYINNSNTTNNGLTKVNNAGTLNNKNNFANNGTIETSICGIIIQDSPLDIAATVLHDGIIYELQGNVEETNLEFGVVYNDINQTKPPVPGCKGGFVLQLDEDGTGTLTVADVDKGGYGNCGATLVNKTIDRTEFTLADLGSQLVTLTVEDNFGLTASCDAVITVIEYVPPIEPIDDPEIEFACPDDITITPQPGESFVAVEWDEPGDATTTCLGVEECVSRSASNTTNCHSNIVYGFYFKFEGLDYYYAISNGVLVEYEDGTANYTALATNNDNSNYQFELDINLSGRTFSAPAGSPKSNSCESADESNWYYYTETTGTMTGVAGLEGALVSVTRFGESFQLGYGANATDGTNGFGASGWLDGNIENQPTNGPTLTIEYGSNNNAGDINIMLSGDGNECRQTAQCSETPNDIPGFIFMGEYNDTKYYCSDTNNWTWTNAKAEAEANGGRLAIVDDIAENDFIQSGIIADYAWIGLTDEAEEGVYTWVNGEESTFFNWSSGEPNNSGSGEDYVRMLKSNGKWTDRDQHFTAEFVMEIPCSNAAPTCADISENKPGFTFLGEFNSSKYYLSDHASDWGYAKSNSEAKGGHLVVIDDAAENDFILNAINPASGSVWTGLNTVDSPHEFNWVDGSAVDYTYWETGEPNGNGVDQAVRLKNSNGKWTDRPAYSYSYEYVMEIPCNIDGNSGSCEEVVLDIVFDNYPEDVSWEIKNANNEVVASGGNYGSQPDGSSISISTCLTDGCYDFIISDSYGDGICCQYGNGSYTLTGTDGTVYGTGGDYGNGETVNFCISTNNGGSSSEPVVSQISGPLNGGNFAVGTTEVAYEVTDDCGNREVCIFTVTVEENPAEVTADCPADIVVDAAPGAGNAIVNWDDPTGTSTCYIPGVKVSQIDSVYFSGDALPVGVTYIPYNLVDSCNNFAQCLLTINVNGQAAELTLETCPGDINTDSENFIWDVPTASTTCYTGNLEIDQVDGPAMGSNPADGVYEIAYLINDECGNSEVCAFMVTVAASCPASGTPCDDGDDCTTNDIEDGDCNCAGTYTDSDGDGVCDADDICEGGDDNVDTDGDGTPDFCDDCNFAEGDSCDDGDACTTGDTYDANCNCAGTYTDSDGDGVCDADDICEGGDDNVDTDGDGTPDFCDGCNDVGQPCDDGDACTTGDTYDANCNCAGTYTDSDGDGVCDADDICEGGDDNVDTDGDGTPDFCDGCNDVGQPCDDGDACTTGDTYDANCNCVGTYTDSDGDGVCDADDICEGGDDSVDTDGDGTPDFCDDDEPNGDPCEDVVITANQGSITVSNINAPIFNIYIFNSSWGTEYNCNYSCTDPTSIDLAPGTYYVKVSLSDASWTPICEIFEEYEVTEGCNFDAGAPCDDGDACTSNDVYDANCNCSGTLTDSDGDGVCDANDVCPGFDDNSDEDNDGIPDGCDTNECDNVTDGGLVSGDETGCLGYDPSEITVVSAPTGGAGTIEYLWLSSTSGCPTDTLQAIPDANGPSYDPGVITETTYFLRCSRRSDCSAWTGESNCVIKTVDSSDTDADGVCDSEDICEGGDDSLDNDGDGIPNFCDDTPDGGGDPCENIQLTVGAGNVTVSNIDAPIFNIFIFDSSWGTEYNCNFNCVDPTTIDLPAGTYYVKVSLKDAAWGDICEIFETIIIPEGCPYTEGSPCDDGDECTTGDVYDANCNCSGTLADDDNDGVCNAEDLCEGFDDHADEDGDGIPDGCDTNECDNVNDGGEIAGNESGCSGYDPAPITVVSAPSGGAGNIEYIWLSATGSCPTNLTQEIPGATEATYDPGVITETTYFVRCSRRSDCDDWTQGESNCIVKTVNQSDLDNDGVCDAEDVCEGGDDTLDNDGDGIPNHCDDTPDGGGDPCENAVITMGNGSITVSNLDAPIITIMIFDEQWNTVFNCGYDCDDPTTATGLEEGFYHVSIKLYDESWSPICQITPTVHVSTTEGYVSASEEVFEFQAHKNGRAVRTYWVTNTESKNDYFFVERSSDGIEFQTIMNINSVTENHGAFNYFESDVDPFLGESFYRLAKVHHDGTIDYSPVRKVVFDIDLSEFAVFPNPATNEVYIDLQEFEGRSATVSIFNHLGQRMDFRALDIVGASPVRFDLSKYTGGAYTVYINMEGTKNFARKFVVSKL